MNLIVNLYGILAEYTLYTVKQVNTTKITIGMIMTA
jgi:hypothetical protein